MRLPAHADAMVVVASARQVLEAKGDVFETSLTAPDAKELQIFAKRPSGASQYEGILSFPVEG